MFKTASEKIEAVKYWANNSGRCFDLTFVESLETALERYDRLTERQEETLDNIIEKFQIIEWHQEN